MPPERERLGGPRRGRDGRDGRDGHDGKDGTPGLQGRQGERGPQGLPGKDGEPGPLGPMPEHEWQDTRLRFQQGPDGKTWGEWVELRGPEGQPGRVAFGGGGGSSSSAVATSGNSYMPGGWI